MPFRYVLYVQEKKSSTTISSMNRTNISTVSLSRRYRLRYLLCMPRVCTLRDTPCVKDPEMLPAALIFVASFPGSCLQSRYCILFAGALTGVRRSAGKIDK